jgi:hypothetical protein
MDQQIIVTKKTKINKIKQNNGGLICAFEFVRNPNVSLVNSATSTKAPVLRTSAIEHRTLNKNS